MERSNGNLRRNRIDRPATLHGQTPDLEGLAVDGAGRRREHVDVLAEEQDHRGGAEHDGWAEEGQPESDVLLGVHHGDLAAQRADVDHEVEVMVDAGDGRSGVDNDTFALFGEFDERPGLLVLFCDESRAVGPDID